MRFGVKVLAGKLPEHFNDFPKSVENQLNAEYKQIGLFVRDTARQIVPVRTGALRASIGYQVRGVEAGNSGVIVSAGKNYGSFIEYGTRHMRAQPYLNPAMDKAQGMIQAAFTRAIETAKKQEDLD